MLIRKVINKVRSELNKRKHIADSKNSYVAVRADNDTHVQLIFKAVEDVNNQQFTTEELATFKLINDIKKGYINSDRVLVDLDFGAGKNDNNISGSETTVSLSKICKLNSIPEHWGQFMFKLIRNFQPDNCLELGACLGISAAYQTSALKQNNKGKFTTIEGAENIAAIAFESMSKISYDKSALHVGRFSDVLPHILTNENPYDFVFIDGHHSKQATLEYFEKIYPYLQNLSIVIFDDISWSDGMQEAWRKIFTDSRIQYAFDLYKCGICIINKNKTTPASQYYKLYLREK